MESGAWGGRLRIIAASESVLNSERLLFQGSLQLGEAALLLAPPMFRTDAASPLQNITCFGCAVLTNKQSRQAPVGGWPSDLQCLDVLLVSSYRVCQGIDDVLTVSEFVRSVLK